MVLSLDTYLARFQRAIFLNHHIYMSLVIQHGETIEPSPSLIEKAVKFSAHRRQEHLARATMSILDKLCAEYELNEYEKTLSHR